MWASVSIFLEREWGYANSELGFVSEWEGEFLLPGGRQIVPWRCHLVRTCPVNMGLKEEERGRLESREKEGVLKKRKMKSIGEGCGRNVNACVSFPQQEYAPATLAKLHKSFPYSVQLSAARVITYTLTFTNTTGQLCRHPSLSLTRPIWFTILCKQCV